MTSSLLSREHYMRNASMQGHDYIPMEVGLTQAYWKEAREEAEEVCLRHPWLFPDFEKGKIDFDKEIGPMPGRDPYDVWGCEWAHELDGLAGIVVGHPLENWDDWDRWKPPTPAELTEEYHAALEKAAEGTAVRWTGTEHGFLFLRLTYLRGFENLMMDMATEDERLQKLIDVVVDYWNARVQPGIATGVDVLSAADDLGTQTASMMGPKHFRRWLLPAYQRMFRPARDSGAHVQMHHDGYVLDIADEIIESGVTIVNPQDLVNGIDNLAEVFKGRVCIYLDIDRQEIVPFGTPSDVREMVKEEVMKLGSPQGGLMMMAGIYPPTPPENLDALCSALKEFRTYWVGR